MATVTLPEELVSKLRAIEGDEQTDLSELVARALRKYLSKPEAERLVRHAEEIEAALARAGITEEELVEHFHEWRRRQRSCG
jgi:metal-responsive CopG/Arc/MetJ family transcriptional regulator